MRKTSHRRAYRKIRNRKGKGLVGNRTGCFRQKKQQRQKNTEGGEKVINQVGKEPRPGKQKSGIRRAPPHSSSLKNKREAKQGKSSSCVQSDPCCIRNPEPQHSWKDRETPCQLFCGESGRVFARRTWAPGTAHSGSEEARAARTLGPLPACTRGAAPQVMIRK